MRLERAESERPPLADASKVFFGRSRSQQRDIREGTLL